MEIRQLIDEIHEFALAAGFSAEKLCEPAGLPVYAYRRDGTSKRCIYLSSGVHGDEPAGPLAILSLLKKGFFQSDYSWLMCPLLNPAGLLAGTRETPAGIDLNRDYLARRSEEAKAHTSWLDKQPVPELFLSLHEDWESSGFYLYEINVACKPSFSRQLLACVSEVMAIEPEPLIDDHQVKEPGWIFHEAAADEPENWPEAIYMAERGACVSYTLETPSSLELDLRIRAHVAAVECALAQLKIDEG
ncbi:M14 family metallopeptidase [Persicirhabdus sediminis]|uniref:M14 family metallocarboxypeptidase n=1 Tax=Persicirhabdus sediminis TaxID=454144 RepID=A0A8J7SII4_9BACT|nr:M14 family metallocarboxypeptidase [Persicirhabdus sediminis]MBK1790466.1 M14 family metallocarboxypeptidase [Persicirhabdus sediminis]